MKKLLILILAALPVMAVDGTMLSMVMPGAKAVAGGDANRVLASPAGQFLLSQMNLESGHFKEMMTLTGFDPRRDVREILIVSNINPANAAVSNTQPKQDDGLLVVRGTFDLSRLTSLAGTAGASLTTYKNYPVLNQKDSQWVAFPTGFAVAGTTAQVKAALDRLQSGASPDAALAAKIADVSSRFDVWMMAEGFSLPAVPQGANQMIGQTLQGIEATTGGIKFGADVVFTMEALTRSPADATALTDVLRFVASMAQSAKPDAPGIALFNTLQASTNGRTASFTMSLPQTEFERMVKPKVRIAAVR